MAERAASNGSLPRLTAREYGILQMIAEGAPTKVIAEKLGVAPKTIEHGRASLMEKLGVHDVASVTRVAMQSGLI